MFPDRVYKALEKAKEFNVTSSCIPEVGQLLRVLVTQSGTGTIAEIGTGCGVASAWMLDALQEKQTFSSVESDSRLYQAVSQSLNHPRARFIRDDWKTRLTHALFELVFVDVAEAKDEAFESVIAATAIGGLIFLDDFTPHKYQPIEWQAKPDLRRERWRKHSQLISAEILTTEKTSAILATRAN